jgi:hypothetical protein
MLPLLLLLAQEPGPRALEDVPLTLRVNHAIALGVEYLEGMQAPDGTFPFHDGPHRGGTTALAAYTLVKSGVRRDAPAVRRALDALAGHEFRSTYAASVHLLLCEALRDEARERDARRSLEYLLEHQERGVWGYPWGHLCNSNTQFALLALRAAARMGLEVPEASWLAAIDGLGVFQNVDGGFRYRPEKGGSYASITAAALASWAVLGDIGRDSAKLRRAHQRHADDVERGVAWLEAHFDVARNRRADGTWTPAWHHAYLWAVERWCGLTERERVADRDWYSAGASWLVETQRADGSWGDDERALENTCFALLFLRRSTVSGGAEVAALDAEIERLRRAQLAGGEGPGDGALRVAEWLLAGPWLQERGESLLEEPPFEPGDVRPRAGTKVARRAWERVTLHAERWTDLDGLTDRGGDRQLWALATWLAWEPPGSPESPENPQPLEGVLWLELDDGWDVWLGGQRLARERKRERGAAGVDDVRLPIVLAPGEHLLIVLVEDLNGAAAFGARVSTADGGAPPPGLTVRAGR